MGRTSNSLSESLRIGQVLLGDGTFGSELPGMPVENTEGLNAQVVWSKGTDILKSHLDRQIFTAWIKPLSILAVDVSDDRQPKQEAVEVTLGAPNRFCRDHVERHYGGLISTTLSQILGEDTTVTIKVKQSMDIGTKAVRGKQPKTSAGVRKSESSVSARTSRRKISSPSRSETNLNPTYNFSNFIASAVSLKVAENPGTTYNPLFIYGGVGLGKTHLANAIGNASYRRDKKVLMLSSETFVSELIAALRSNNMVLFKNKLRNLDLLIIDDIQFIIGKERTQEEFFHTFNELYNRHKQIVITSDKVPQELVGLEERLRTRFACGVSADLQAPDFETRVAILSKKSEAIGLLLSDEVARLLAERIDTNVRELEGALNRLQALCSLHNTSPSLELAQEVLESVAPGRCCEITTEIIQKAVASRYNVGLNDLLGKRRTQNIASARQVAMFLCRRLTSCSYPEIGALFGGRDHSTAIHANRVIAERIKKDCLFHKEIKEIEKKLQS